MAQLQFINAQEEYSVKEFYELHKNILPQLVTVTQGFCGEVSLEIFDREQVFRIHTYSVQKRVVAELTGGSNITGVSARQISIPVDYNMKFCVVNQKSSNKDESLSDILATYKFPVDVQFSKTSAETFKIGSMERSSSQVVRLRLVDTYEDTYLLGNAICEGSLYGKVTAIPVYLPDLRLSLVTGLGGNMQDKYERILEQMTMQVEAHIKFETSYGNEDIAVYSPEEVSGNVNYAFVSPQDYYEFSEIFKDKPKSKQNQRRSQYEELMREMVSQGNVYDIIPADQNTYEAIKTVTSGDVVTENKILNPTYGKPPPPAPKPKPIKKQDKKPPPALPTPAREKSPETPPRLKQQSYSDSTSQIAADISTKGQAVVSPLPNLPPEVPKRNSYVPVQMQELSTSENYNVAKMSIEDIGEWLVKLNLGKYKEDFEEKQIDGTILRELDVDILKEEFLMKGYEAIKLMKFAKDGYVPKSRSDASSI